MTNTSQVLMTALSGQKKRNRNNLATSSCTEMQRTKHLHNITCQQNTAYLNASLLISTQCSPMNLRGSNYGTWILNGALAPSTVQ